jgi:hypothetical protein
MSDAMAPVNRCHEISPGASHYTKLISYHNQQANLFSSHFSPRKICQWALISGLPFLLLFHQHLTVYVIEERKGVVRLCTNIQNNEE